MVEGDCGPSGPTGFFFWEQQAQRRDGGAYLRGGIREGLRYVENVRAQ